jgi:hypothetical protein
MRPFTVARPHKLAGAFMHAFTRHEIVAALSAAAVLPLLPGCSINQSLHGTTTEAAAKALLDSIAENLLRLSP